MNKDTDHRCDIHTFDPAKLPSAEVAERGRFSVHDMGIGSFERGKIKRLKTIMMELGHSHINILKIDVEGNEKESLPSILDDKILDSVEQLSIEFHSVELMKEGLDLIQTAGFGIVYARREDRCMTCTEVTMVRIK